MSETHENIDSCNDLRQSLEERELTERAFLDALGQPALLISAEGTVIMANNRGAAMIGRRTDEVIGMRVHDLMPADIAAQWQETIKKVTSFRQPSQLDYVRKAREISAHFRPIAAKSGEVAFVAVFETDVTEQKRTERELFESKQMLQMVLDNIPQRVFWKDRNCRYLGCNRSFLADAGLGDVCDIVGRNDLDLAWRELAGRYQADDRQVMEVDEARINYEEPLENADGSLSWVRTSKVPLHDREGNVIGVLGTYEDITERKNADEALQRSEEEFRAMFELSRVGLAQADPSTGRFIRVNRKFCEITGYPEDELLGLTFVDITHPEDRTRDMAGFNRVLSGERDTWEIEKRYVRKDGKVVFVNVNGILLRDHGKPYRSVTLIQDMTKRKEDEEILRRGREQLQAIIDAVPSLISYVDRNLHYRWHNRAYYEWFQLSADAIADRHMRDVLGEDAFQRILPRVLKGLSGETVQFDDCLPFRAGGERWVHGVYVPHRDRSGDVDGIVIFVSDITARKRNEDELRKAVERFDLLSRTARRLLESESPQDAIHGLCTEVLSYLDCDVFFNFLVDKNKGRLRLNACAGVPDETSRKVGWLDYGEAVCGCVARDGKGIVCENVHSSSDHRNDFVKSLRIKAYACFPLFAHGTVAGTISFGNRSRDAFREDEQTLMKSFADLVSIAMERMRTRETLEALVHERTAALETEFVDRMHAQVALRQSEERYRNLAAHLQSLREDERARIAREVHDELGQVLAGMNFDVSTLAAKYHDHKPVIERTESISRQIVAALQTVKRICTELRPSILDHFGISEAIKWQAEEFQKRSGIACTVSVKPDVIVLDGDLSTVVFRIFQEALTNIARHAEASEIVVVFKQESGTVVLNVTDNGRGIEEEHISGSSPTFGLMGIRERAEHAGGQVVIKRNRGGGTTVLLRIPLKDRSPGNSVSSRE